MNVYTCLFMQGPLLEVLSASTHGQSNPVSFFTESSLWLDLLDQETLPPLKAGLKIDHNTVYPSNKVEQTLVFFPWPT